MTDWLPVRNREGEVSKYAIKSSCGRWRIAKVTVCGVDKYEVWDGQVRVGDYPTAAEAKEAVK